MRRALSLFALLSLAGCDPATSTDAGGTDAPLDLDTPPTSDTPSGEDGGGGGGCGTGRPMVNGVDGTEGLIIGRDGTIYYSQSRAVGRIAPGRSSDSTWVSLPGTASTVWGIALDAANETLYVGSPTAGAIYSVDLTAATPTATVFVASAGAPNGLTVGPDGALYYSDFGGNRVMRVPAEGGTPTAVTTSAIVQANGVAFDDDGTLLVASYGTGVLFRLTLSAGVETGRTMAATGLGSPDGVALDANGDIWVTDNAGRVLHVTDAGATVTPVRMGVTSAASLDFGVGELSCGDLYVASGGSMLRLEDVGVNGADVLWH